MKKLLCQLLGCNWTTDEIHSQLSVVCKVLDPIPLHCCRCGNKAWGRWEQEIGVSLHPPEKDETPKQEFTDEP